MFSARANLPDDATTRAPCSQAQFCKELVKAGQCIEGVDYEPDEDNREYYERLVGEHLLVLPYVRSLLVENMPVLLDEVGDGDLAIESIAYAQLKTVRSVIGIELPVADGTFQTFLAPSIRTAASKTKKCELGVKVVMGPSGGLYEPQTKAQAKYTFSLNCRTSSCTMAFKILCGAAARAVLHPHLPAIRRRPARGHVPAREPAAPAGRAVHGRAPRKAPHAPDPPACRR